MAVCQDIDNGLVSLRLAAAGRGDSQSIVAAMDEAVAALGQVVAFVLQQSDATQALGQFRQAFDTALVATYNLIFLQGDVQQETSPPS